MLANHCPNAKTSPDSDKRPSAEFDPPCQICFLVNNSEIVKLSQSGCDHLNNALAYPTITNRYRQMEWP
ncbi:MAG: hypothetical protein GAKPKEKM_01672 [Rhodocyclaceae bacterium]|nr:hypothetical protein [Rhodocyclaceae bacterium]